MKKRLLVISTVCIFCMIGCAQGSGEKGVEESGGKSVEEMESQYESMMAEYESEQHEIPDYIKALYGEDDIETSSKIKESVDISSDKQYEAGQYKVGVDMPAGEYMIYSNTGERSANFYLTEDSNGKEIIASNRFDYNNIIYVNDNEYFKLNYAFALPIEEVRELPIDKANMFKIGVFLPAGEYKLRSTSDKYSGFYCIYNDNRQSNIEASDIFKGQAYVTVKEGQYLYIRDCKIEQ